MSNALENYYNGLGNVVLRNTNGNPSIFVKHMKQNSCDFFPELPDHVHPAFKCGDDTYDSILISKYFLSMIDGSGPLYSLPNGIPASIGALNGNINNAFQRIKEGGIGAAPMTIAAYGLLGLIILSQNIRLHGCNYYGTDYDSITSDKANYRLNKSYSVGDRCYFRGWEIECKKDHTSSSDLLPCDAPMYWKYIRKRFATMINFSNTGDTVNGLLWLSGSGPIDWYLDSNIRNEADLLGLRTMLPDFRIKSGHLQLIPYNLAADPSTDISDTSDAWREIKPHQDDHECDFVEPGTSGTLRWVRRTVNGGEVLTLTADDNMAFGANGWFNVKFADMDIDDVSVPKVPYLLYELGLVPIPGVDYKNAGISFYRSSAGTYPIRFGSTQSSSRQSFLGDLNCNSQFSNYSSSDNDICLRACAMGNKLNNN